MFFGFGPSRWRCSLTFCTVDVSSRHSWMIVLLVGVKSLVLDSGVLGRERATATQQVSGRSSATTASTVSNAEVMIPLALAKREKLAGR